MNLQKLQSQQKALKIANINALSELSMSELNKVCGGAEALEIGTQSNTNSNRSGGGSTTDDGLLLLLLL